MTGAGGARGGGGAGDGVRGALHSKDFYPDGGSERGASSDLCLNRATQASV